eukprot:scaffold2312_cov165-Ochromonas_danica.AAC.56
MSFWSRYFTFSKGCAYCNNEECKKGYGRCHQAFGINPTPPVVTKSKKRSALFRDMLVSLQEADSSGAAEVVDEKPLLWWAENAYKYPFLSMIARKMLCIPATSASSERLFSLAGRTITDERSTLGSSLARNLIYLRANWVSTDVRYPLRSSSLKRPRVEEEENNDSTIVEID